MKWLTWVAVLSGFLTAAVPGRAGEAAGADILDRPVTVSVEDKTYEELVAAVAKAAGVRIELVDFAPLRLGGLWKGNSGKACLAKMDPGPNPEDFSADSRAERGKIRKQLREHQENQYRKHGWLGWRWEGRVRVYTINMPKALPLRQVLREVGAMEGLRCLSTKDGANLLPYEKLPFDPAIAAEVEGIEEALKPEPDWRKAVLAVRKAWSDKYDPKITTKAYDRNGKGIVHDGVRPAQPGDRIVFERKPVQVLQDANHVVRTALDGIAGHPQKDAIRAWLLFDAVTAIMRKRRADMTPSTTGLVVSAVREANAIMKSDDGVKELDALLTLLKSEVPLPISAGQADKRGTAEIYNVYLHFGAIYTAGISSSSYEESVGLLKDLARVFFKWGRNDCCYDAYFHALSGLHHYEHRRFGDKVVGEAKAALACSQELFKAEDKWWLDNYAKRSDDWKCPDCNWDKHEHNPVSPTARCYRRLAQACLATGDLAGAVTNWGKALELVPKAEGYWYDCDVLMPGYDMANTLNTMDDWLVWVEYAAVLTKNGQTKEASAAFDTAKRYCGVNDLGRMRIYVARALRETVGAQAVIDFLKKEQSQEPGSTELAHDLAIECSREGDFEAAIASYEILLKAAPQGLARYPGALERLRKTAELAKSPPVVFGGHWYKMYLVNRSWREAKAMCEAKGGYLACVDSKEENDFLTKLTSGRQVWLGATDEKTEGKWIWVNGKEMTFANWADGQPDTGERGRRENYLLFNDRGAGRWGDANWAEGFICEWDQEPKQEGK